MPDKKKRKKPLKYQGKKKTSLSEPEKESADQTPPPKSPEESGSPELDPSVNVQGADTISQSIEDKMTTLREPGPDSSSSISDDDLDRLLSQHEEWVRMGKPQDKSGPVSLKGFDLSGKDFSGRNLEEIILKDAILKGAKFEGTILIKANLRGADLEGADLRQANFWGADLESANLKGVDNYITHNQFGGTNLRFAINIPQRLNFTYAINKLEGNIKKAGIRFLWTGLILFIIFLFVIFIKSDIDLHTKNHLFSIAWGATKFDISNQSSLWIFIPIFLIFFLCIPFHVYLQISFYNKIIELPAIYVTGNRLDNQIHWLFNIFLSKDFPHLDTFPDQQFLIWLYKFFVAGFVWILTPFLIWLFWLRYLSMHDWDITRIHIILLSILIIILMYLYFLGRGKLRYGKHNKVFLEICRQRSGIIFCSVVFIFIIILTMVSWVAINGFYRIPMNFCYANLQNSQVSGASIRTKNLRHLLASGSKLNDWIFIRGADLYGARLQGAELDGAEFIGAHLEQSDLTQRCSLKNADLRGAFLSGAIGSEANFQGSKLERAKLIDARLERANFHMAKLQYANFENAKLMGACFISTNASGAIFKNADLSNADFSKVCLDNVNFEGADLTGTNFQEADLRLSKGVTPQQWGAAKTQGARPPKF